MKGSYGRSVVRKLIAAKLKESLVAQLMRDNAGLKSIKEPIENADFGHAIDEYINKYIDKSQYSF